LTELSRDVLECVRHAQRRVVINALAGSREERLEWSMSPLFPKFVRILL
jgi:hypothetical protein